MGVLHSIDEHVQVVNVSVVEVITILLVNDGQLKAYFSFRCYLCR